MNALTTTLNLRLSLGHALGKVTFSDAHHPSNQFLNTEAMNLNTSQQTHDETLAELRADRGAVAHYLHELALAVDHELVQLMKVLPLACLAGACRCRSRRQQPSANATDELVEVAINAAIRRAMSMPAVVRVEPPQHVLPDAVLQRELTRRLNVLARRRRAAPANAQTRVRRTRQ